MRTKVRIALEKFPLELKNGVQAMTMEDLRANFDLEKIIGYFQEEGKLERWLRDRFYENEADAVKVLSLEDKNFVEKICAILCINELPEIVLWRKERRKKLSQFTNNATVLQNIDDVAFNQDELEDILREENLPDTIYLCDKIFRFPSGILKKKNIRYVGVIDKVIVFVESDADIDLKKLDIIFENVTIEKGRGYSKNVSNAQSSKNDANKNQGNNKAGAIFSFMSPDRLNRM